MKEMMPFKESVSNLNFKSFILYFKIVQSYGSKGKTIIFTRTKKDADRVYRFANKIVRGAGCMHGDIPQMTREETLDDFKSGRMNLLVATDVASRGLDIPHVDLII